MAGHAGIEQVDRSEPIGRAAAEAMADRVLAAGAEVAQRQAEFLRLLGDFDHAGAMRWWYGFSSLAHWLAWACSMAPGTAREHVRIARALRRMPVTSAAFGRGEVSFSKVRELTRLVDHHDEDTLLILARAATASQLARTVSAYRAVPGTHAARERRTRVSWSHRDDGCVQLSATLSPEDGAAVVAALEDAVADLRDAPTVEGDARVPTDLAESEADRSRRSRVAALVAMAEHWLAARPEDRSGEDRTTVVIEVDAAVLAGSTARCTAGSTAGRTAGSTAGCTFGWTAGAAPGDTTSSEPPRPDVPAGTCRVRGQAGVEPETARRRACEGQVHAVVRGLDGEPLAVSRTRRFGTRAQRRALMVRDGHCQFPGCARERRLKVHHVVSWLDGGPTDLDNLMLLCQHHHTTVHEGGITVEPVEPAAAAAAGDAVIAGGVATARWRFLRPDGTVIVPEVVAHRLDLGLPPLCDGEGRPLTGPDRERALLDREELLEHHRARQAALEVRRAEIAAASAPQERPGGLAAQPIFPVGGGEGFDLGNCVAVLFTARRRAERRSGPADDRAA